MELISNILYWLSTGLMIPVTLFLLFFFLRALLMIGGFYGHYMTRTKINVKLNREFEHEPVDQVLDKIAAYGQRSSTLVATLERMKINRDRGVMLDKILGDYEITADKELSKSKLLVKIGPMLGLLGTLIPMGPALVGLATGDVSSMASNMQVAFATTVVGIIIGAIGFITLQVKQRWAADDMNMLEYVVESLKNK